MIPILENKDLEIKPTNPLLLSVDNEDDFRNADFRVMFFGQETKDWSAGIEPQYRLNPQHDDDIGFILNIYKEFYNSGYCYIHHGGQFWNGVNRFRKMLGEKYPDKKICYVWNNIVKIGIFEDKGCPPNYIYDVERKYFSVVKEEINIIKPNVILFLTGPNYDNKISDTFGQVTYSALSPFSERELAKISIPDVDVAFRTYHPGYLWRNNIERFFDAIVDEI